MRYIVDMLRSMTKFVQISKATTCRLLSNQKSIKKIGAEKDGKGKKRAWVATQKVEIFIQSKNDYAFDIQVIWIESTFTIKYVRNSHL